MNDCRIFITFSNLFKKQITGNIVHLHGPRGTRSFNSCGTNADINFTVFSREYYNLDSKSSVA